MTTMLVILAIYLVSVTVPLFVIWYQKEDVTFGDLMLTLIPVINTAMAIHAFAVFIALLTNDNSKVIIKGRK